MTPGAGAVPLGAAALALLAGCGGSQEEEPLPPGGDTITVESLAMTPTFSPGEKLSVERSAYLDEKPEVGDVVVVHPPAGIDSDQCGVPAKEGEPCAEPVPETVEDVEFLERIVAGPGDEIAFERGAAIVNGKAAREDFVEPCSNELCDLPKAITVPRGHWFVAGDNRADASDSRVWGPVPFESITGRVED